MQLGTCAMKPRSEGGVVDSKLNVYGVENLKVADLSIPPSNVAAVSLFPECRNREHDCSYVDFQNTYSTTLGVAEKAALIIAADLGITGV